MSLLFFGGFAMLILGGWLGSVYAENKRRAALTAWAASQGLSFSLEQRSDFEQEYPGFSALQRGDNRYAYHVMTGTWKNYPVVVFDYHYETHSTDSKGNQQTHHHHFSGTMVQCPIPFRHLVIRPENFLDRIGAAIGFEAIQFESAEFNRKFHVTADDKRWAFDVIHQRTMEFLLQEKPAGVIEFVTQNGLMSASSLCRPEELGFALEVVTGILDRLPDYVRQQQTTNP